MSIQSTEIIGYAADGEVICPECAVALSMDQMADVWPLFAEDMDDIDRATCAGWCRRVFHLYIPHHSFGWAGASTETKENEL